MKLELSVLVILAFLSMFTLTVYADNTIIATTDKTEYYNYEIVYVNGTVSEYSDDRGLTYIITHNDKIVEIFQTEPNPDSTFNFEIELNTESLNTSGEYTIILQYFSYIEITFEILPDSIKIQSDKSSYNEIETIYITGQVNNINTTDTDRVGITVYDKNDSIMIPEELLSITNNTFTHSIITDDVIWNDYTDDVKIEAQFQNFTDSINITYSPYPATLSLETLYDNIITNNDTLAYHDSMINQYNDMIISQNNTITLQQLQIDDLRNDLSVMGGYLTNLNVTLGIDYPPILNENAIKEVNFEIDRLQDEIDVGNILISDTLLELEISQAEDETDKVVKLTETLGSAILSKEMAQSKLNMIYLYLEIYPQ